MVTVAIIIAAIATVVIVIVVLSFVITVNDLEHHQQHYSLQSQYLLALVLEYLLLCFHQLINLNHCFE
jgi:succinate dehydrogenase hydrophobic anchor subunit